MGTRREDLMAGEHAVSTSRLRRLFDGGRSAVGLARTMLGPRDGLPDLEAVAVLTRRLGELKGLGMKLGQIISFIDPSLPPETRELLSLLQRQAPASEAGAVRATIEQAFGARASELLAVMDPKPFAVASIGQVHRATLPGVGPVAVKVVHPNIETALRNDFQTALSGVSATNALLFGLASDAKDLALEARDAILAECDLSLEASHQRAFCEWARRDEVLLVPEVIDAWSSRSVLTTRWEAGATLEAFLAASPSQDARDRAGAALFRASVHAFTQLGLLHADPHPGNFAFRDGRVILYDFGCVRRFERVHVEAFRAMGLALRANDRVAMVRAAQRFGFTLRGDDAPALLERFARSFFAPMLVDGPSVIPPDTAVDARQLAQDKRALRKLGLPPKLLFLLRLRFGLYAVLSRLGARCDWAALELQAG